MILRCPRCLHHAVKSTDGNYYCDCGYNGQQTDFYAEDIED